MRAHSRQAFTFSLKQRQGQGRPRHQNQEDDIQVDQQRGTNRASPTTLVTDSNMKVGEDSWTNSWCNLTVTSGHHGLGTSGFGSLGGIQARSLLSSSTFHQRIMSGGREPLAEEGSWIRAHMRQAVTFSLKQRQGQRRARQQHQEDDIQVDQQSGTNRASPANIPQRLML